MSIRQWLGYEIPKIQLSEVDLKLNEILNQYRGIFEQYCDIEASLSLAELNQKVIDKFFDNTIFNGFFNWFTTEGKVALIGLGRNLYKYDEILIDELDYLEFILSSESNNVKKYPDDVIGTLVDITDQLDMLLSSALIELELVGVSSRIVIPQEPLIGYKKHCLEQYGDAYDILGSSDIMGIRDSYINCESPFYID